MSSIESCGHIQSLALSTYGQGDILKPSTRLRLEALGIDPSTVTSETQAQILIAQAEAAKNHENSDQQNNRGGNSSQQELISKTKKLASEIGVNIFKKDSLEKMIEKVSHELNLLEKNRLSKEKVQNYHKELSSLTQEAKMLSDTQQNIFNEMNMVSISNRYLLGL